MPDERSDASARSPFRHFASLWGCHDAVTPAPLVAPVSGAILIALAAVAAAAGGAVEIADRWQLFGTLLTALLLASALPLPGGEPRLRSAPGGVPMGLLIGVAVSQPWTVAVALAAAVPPIPAWTQPRASAWQLWLRGSAALTVAVAWLAVQWLPRDPAGYALRALLFLPVGLAVRAVLTAGLAGVQGSRGLPPPAGGSWRSAGGQLALGATAAAVTIFALEYASPAERAAVTVVAAAAAALWAAWTSRTLAERQRELHSQVGAAAAAADQLQDLYRMVARERQHNRDMLARELHDQVLQNLGASRSLTRLSPQQGQEVFEGALAAMRGIIDDLRSPVVEQLGLRAAVEQQADRVARQHDVPVSASVGRPLVDLRGPSAQQIMAACRLLLGEAIRRDGCEAVSVGVTLRDRGEAADTGHLSPLPGPHAVVTVTFDGAADAPSSDDVDRLSGQFDGVVTAARQGPSWSLVAEVPLGLHDDDAAAAAGGDADGG